MHKESNITFKGINKLAIPAIISGIVEPLLSITDTAIVGNIQVNPTEALAAVGIAGSFISALVWILAQTRSAISATVAKYVGAKKLNEIATLPAQIIGINFILSIAIYLITILFVNEIPATPSAGCKFTNKSASFLNSQNSISPLMICC